MSNEVVAVAAFAGLLGVFAWASIFLYLTPAGQARFESSYANANQRTVECVFWCVRHVWKAFTAGPAGKRLARAALAAWIGSAMVALATLIVIQSSAPPLANEGVAVGAGALIWSCVLEAGSLPERTHRLTGAAIIAVPLWFLATLLFIADLVLLLATASGFFSAGAVEAGAVGAAFVALADISSFVFGLMLAAQSETSLLGDP